MGGRFPRDGPPVPPAPAARFPPNSTLATQRHFGACFLGHKKPLREWGRALLRFSSQKHSFWLCKSLGACFGGHKKPLREARGLTPWFSVEIKKRPDFLPLPKGFRTENAITRLSRIRLTTIFKAEYITFRDASFWMGPGNSRQSNFVIDTRF